MRVNQFIAKATGISRRAADKLVDSGQVAINNQLATAGQQIQPNDTVQLNGKTLILPATSTTIMLNKPAGYICSRDGQGSKTVYDLLPKELHNLKPVGRLDKDSTGLLLLTNDGQLANQLTHPSYQKLKVYLVKLNKPLTQSDSQKVEQGVTLEDGPSKFSSIAPISDLELKVSLSEGRNRQIRRTFEALGYRVTELHRTNFGDYKLNELKLGEWQAITQQMSK